MKIYKQMKIKYIVFLVAFFNSYNSISQEIFPIDTTKWLCQYDYTFLQDSTSRSSLKKINMVLQVGSHLSCFCDLDGFVTDSLHYMDRNNADFATSASIAFRKTSGIPRSLLCMYKVYKNYPGKGKVFFSGHAGKFLRVIEPKTMKWKMEADKDTVLSGFHCQKASTRFAGRTYIAWYTSQIPIDEGPYKFNGLPGLILKIYDIKKQHDFEIKSITRVKYIHPIYYCSSNYTDVSAKEYVKALQIDINELSGRILNNSISFNDDERKAKSLQRLKSLNNFIERY
jgi:GLPGLI family protein